MIGAVTDGLAFQPVRPEYSGLAGRGGQNDGETRRIVPFEADGE